MNDLEQMITKQSVNLELVNQRMAELIGNDLDQALEFEKLLLDLDISVDQNLFQIYLTKVLAKQSESVNADIETLYRAKDLVPSSKSIAEFIEKNKYNGSNLIDFLDVYTINGEGIDKRVLLQVQTKFKEYFPSAFLYSSSINFVHHMRNNMGWCQLKSDIIPSSIFEDLCALARDDGFNLNYFDRIMEIEDIFFSDTHEFTKKGYFTANDFSTLFNLAISDGDVSKIKEIRELSELSPYECSLDIDNESLYSGYSRLIRAHNFKDVKAFCELTSNNVTEMYKQLFEYIENGDQKIDFCDY